MTARRERAGVALLAVGAHVGELHGRTRRRGERLRRPDVLVEALEAAVQRVGTVVGGELVLLAVQGEGGVGDPVAVAADDGPEVRVRLQVAVDRVEAEGHVGGAARAVGHDDPLHDGAPRDDVHLHAVRVLERVALDRGAVERLAERLRGWRAARRREGEAERHQGGEREEDERDGTERHADLLEVTARDDAGPAGI